MNLRPKKKIVSRYTLWMARTGQSPKAVTFPVWFISAGILMLLAWTGLNVYLWGKTTEMRIIQTKSAKLAAQSKRLNKLLATEQYRNNALSGDANSILKKLSALESEINVLRRRAGMKELEQKPIQQKAEGTGGGSETEVALEERLNYSEMELERLTSNLDTVSPELSDTLNREKATPEGLPLHGHSRTASSFGYRRSPFGWRLEFHDGLDFPAPYGTAIYATADGVVESAGWRNVFGQAVVVNHGYGYKTLYGHMSSIQVRAGQRVSRGDLIGKVGSTGRSTGPHLHYTVFSGGRQINPRGFL